MMWKNRHIVLLLAVTVLFAGCARELLPFQDGPGIRLTVRCDSSVQTKAEDKDGEQAFNENLIRSVDFLFYKGMNPDPDADAIYHVRKELSNDPMGPGLWEATFNLVIKKEIVESIFTQANSFKGTVYALVNFDASFIDDLSNTSANDLHARRLVTDFAAAESNYVQPKFLMDGRAVVVFNEHGEPNVDGEITVKRFASKLTVSISLANQVVLKHSDEVNANDEVWTPIPHTMRIYLVDGVKSVLLTEDGIDPSPDFVSYSGASNRRPFLSDAGTPYLSTETVSSADGEKLYYNTWPMYSYPATWSYNLVDHTQVDYTQGLPHEQPYFKLEMDWRREAQNGYSYDRRKYYYKVFMPFNQFIRNNWYGFYLDVSILGSETDEGKAVLEPTCYLLDWQNKSLAINKYAVISKARYLSVDKSSWEISNQETLTIPFTSSHNVMVVEGSVKATRPFYGEITGTQQVGSYSSKLHAWIRKKDGENAYYLDFTNQQGATAGNQDYEPSNWLTNTSTSILLDHPLQNDFTKDDFDYSPYTIDFDIVHTDLAEDPSSHTYSQYLRHITIVQYPAIYIKLLHNSDTEIKKKTDPHPYGYDDGEAPWADKPWGYVYVNGGRFVRWDNKTSASTSSDPFFDLTTANCKREYQWQTVWYTGGSQDMFDIHVTVLPKNSSYVIGDPREDEVNNLDSETLYPNLYRFTVDGNNEDEINSNLQILENVRAISDINPYGTYHPDRTRVGFNVAKALYGEEYRSLKWYYPTEKSTRTEDMLAPSYRIASKFGGTEYGGNVFSDLSLAYAEYRCAAYQEDGFPAGRWRLPTKAEIKFIAQLSAKKAFERLFSNATYWSANGAITVNGDAGTVSNSSNKTALLRCVYDSWYWDKVDGLEGDPRRNPRDEFVWGDKER